MNDIYYFFLNSERRPRFSIIRKLTSQLPVSRMEIITTAYAMSKPFFLKSRDRSGWYLLLAFLYPLDLAYDFFSNNGTRNRDLNKTKVGYPRSINNQINELDINIGQNEHTIDCLITFDANQIGKAQFGNYGKQIDWRVLVELIDYPHQSSILSFLHSILLKRAHYLVRYSFYKSTDLISVIECGFPIEQSTKSTMQNLGKNTFNLISQELNRSRFSNIDRKIDPQLARVTTEFFLTSQQIKTFVLGKLRKVLENFRVISTPNQQVWQVRWIKASNSSSGHILPQVLESPQNVWFADPFLYFFQDLQYLFVEEFNTLTGKGKIACFVESAGNFRYLGIAIEESFHLSFPFIFEFKNELYMIPECGSARSVRIYRCQTFPLEWKLVREYDTGNNSYYDQIVFEENGIWWMLATVDEVSGGDAYSSLNLFWTNDPIKGNWTAHVQNPLFIDSRKGRNGGLHKCEEGLFRFGQEYGFLNYGESLNSYKITTLNRSEYQEEPTNCKHFFKLEGFRNFHHLFLSQDYIVFDCKP